MDVGRVEVEEKMGIFSEFREKTGYLLSRAKVGKVRNSIIFSVSRVIQLIFTSLSSIVSARLLGPQDYGFATLVFSWSNWLGPLSDLGLTEASVKFGSEKGTEPKDYVTTAVLSHIILSVLSFLFFSLLAEPIAKKYNMPMQKYLILAAFPYIILACTFGAMWTIKRKFEKLAKVMVIDGIQSFLITAVFVYFYGFDGFFYAAILTTLVVILMYWTDVEIGKFRLDYLKKMLPYGMLIAIAGVLSTILQNYDKVLLGYYSGSEQLAYYSLAYRAAFFILFVPQAVQFVMLPELSELFSRNQTGELKRLFRKMLKFCFLFAVVASAGIFFLFSVLVKYFLPKYLQALDYLPWLLAPFIFEASVGSTATVFLATSNRVQDILVLNIIQVALAVSIGKWLIKFYGVYGAIFSLWLIYGISTGFYLLRTREFYST